MNLEDHLGDILRMGAKTAPLMAFSRGAFSMALGVRGTCLESADYAFLSLSMPDYQASAGRFEFPIRHLATSA
jgi:hypothetical protein